jgi:hypothetical protein
VHFCVFRVFGKTTTFWGFLASYDPIFGTFFGKPIFRDFGPPEKLISRIFPEILGIFPGFWEISGNFYPLFSNLTPLLEGK